MLPASLTLLVLCLLDAVDALRFPVHVRPRRAPAHGRLVRRNAVSVQDVADLQYIANITLGGEQRTVMLDTGSSDLWVTGTVPGTKALGKSATINYAIGSASGPINAASFQWGNYSVDDQAYILVPDSTSLALDTQDGVSGLLGLGPDSGSVVSRTLKTSAGESPLTRIFAQNKTSQNYLSLMLPRLNGTGDSFPSGEVTVSETVPGFENITSMPKLEVDKVRLQADQHFQVLTDAHGIIGPDGEPIDVSSIVPGVHGGKLVAVFDSGFSLPQVPRKVADAIYGRVQGATYSKDSEWWTIPCDQYLNITFMFGGVAYPIHPLDTNSDSQNLRSSDPSNPNCVGPFQPIGSGAFSIIGDYDMILGMGFLRNSYALFDFGDFVSESSNDRGDPFVQLLPLTNAASAKSDFVRLRLGGTDSTASKTLLPASQESHSPLRKGETEALLKERVLSHWPYIFVGGLVLVGCIVAFCVWRCCCRNRRKGGPGGKGKKMWKGRAVLQGNPYQQLHEPAPQAMQMGAVGAGKV